MKSAPGFRPRRILKFAGPGLVTSKLRGPARHGHAIDADPVLPESGATRLFVPATIGGIKVDLTSYGNAMAAIMARATKAAALPLAVLSANLDHVHHFGAGGHWSGTLETQGSVEWLTLLDGAPLVTEAGRLTQREWPRLAGSDLIGPILDRAATEGLRVGFLGGSAEAHSQLRKRFAEERADLQVAGWWNPARADLSDAAACRILCEEIAASNVDILVVCLGKPRQELWIARYGALTGAKVMLAFGAVVDFLAGRVHRAPEPVRDLGLEWAWRLALEPRRLAKRYLLCGPAAYYRLRRHSSLTQPRELEEAVVGRPNPDLWASLTPGTFAPAGARTDVAVLVVTYKNEQNVGKLLQSLRRETADQTIKVIVADNSPTPETLDALSAATDVLAFSTGGNLGYAGGLNQAMERAGDADSYLVLNPDLWLEDGAIKALRERMTSSRAGVVVPVLLDEDQSTYPSLRREPSLPRAIGDAFLGSKLPQRPGWLSEMDFSAESYLYPHKVDWATGAALLISPEAAAAVGRWDERFFLYSEETDFCHRVRQSGATIWFEPNARMTHQRGGSGETPELAALMSVNRIRYARKHGTPAYAALVRCMVAAAELLRAPRSRHWLAFQSAAGLRTWEDLPQAVRYPAGADKELPEGAVIIPAHNESAVIRRTLACLEPMLRDGTVEIIVVCNACTDGTDDIAASVPGVRVITVPEASKVTALNAGDRAATKWPRIYLDADISASVDSLRRTLEELAPTSGPMAARPPFRYDTRGAEWLVRAYYRARGRIPAASTALWGAGIYGLSESGHAKLQEFPPLIGDDYYIDQLYLAGEKRIVQCEPVTVVTPRSARALVNTLRRVYRGNSEQHSMLASSATNTLGQLLLSVRGPASALDAAVYAGFAFFGRWGVQGAHGGAWERDETARVQTSDETAYMGSP